MTDEENVVIRTMTPPRFLQEHWPHLLTAHDRKVIEDFIKWAEDAKASYLIRDALNEYVDTAELLDEYFAVSDE